MIAQAMLKSLATPRTSPFFPENSPIGRSLSLYWRPDHTRMLSLTHSSRRC